MPSGMKCAPATTCAVGIEGEPHDGWLLNDFGGIIVHIFSPDRRAYYRLEELWSTGKVLLRLQ